MPLGDRGRHAAVACPPCVRVRLRVRVRDEARVRDGVSVRASG